MTEAITTQQWSPQQFSEQIGDIVAVYSAAMGYAPEVTRLRSEQMAIQGQLPDFRAITVTGSLGVIGFGYGYHSVPGQWWHTTIARNLTPSAYETWFSDCFELAELHVLPSVQGHGLGARILTELISVVPRRTIALSTPEVTKENSRAWRLYRRFGFTDILRDFYFPSDARSFAVLGRPTAG